jgi:hypothetical protein
MMHVVLTLLRRADRRSPNRHRAEPFTATIHRIKLLRSRFGSGVSIRRSMKPKRTLPSDSRKSCPLFCSPPLGSAFGSAAPVRSGVQLTS